MVPNEAQDSSVLGTKGKMDMPAYPYTTGRMSHPFIIMETLIYTAKPSCLFTIPFPTGKGGEEATQRIAWEWGIISRRAQSMSIGTEAVGPEQ